MPAAAGDPTQRALPDPDHPQPRTFAPPATTSPATKPARAGSTEEPSTPPAPTVDEITPPSAVEAPASRFLLGTDIRVPSGTKARIQANLAAIDVLERLRAGGGRPATAAERNVLASWSGWGACAELFDRRSDTYAAERDQLRSVLGADAYRAAAASILNAHYTDPIIAAAMWDAVKHAGLRDGRVLEPGCGSGTFVGLGMR